MSDSIQQVDQMSGCPLSVAEPDSFHQRVDLFVYLNEPSGVAKDHGIGPREDV